MRVDNTSSAVNTFKPQPVDFNRQFSSNRIEQNLRSDCEDCNKMIQKNFKTVDPENGELTTIGERKLIEAIERANKKLQLVDTSFEFTIHEQTHEIMVKVINRETNEIIREIPPEKILDMVAKMWELAGILVDERI